MRLLKDIRSCTYCSDKLPLGPNPVVSFSKNSKVIIVGQAPGLKVHQTNVPWNDASGERLREWLGVTRDDFYNTDLFGIVPMGFCYPGRGKSGDNPPRPKCANLWMGRIFSQLKKRQLTLLVGQYSQKYFLGPQRYPTLTETVKHWEEFLPEYFVLPHPSPRNNIWLKKNSWFETDCVPNLKRLVRTVVE